MKKRVFSFGIALAMIFSLMTFQAFALSSTDFALSGAEVTVDGTENKTVNVVFSAGSAMSILVLEGEFSASSEYLTLSSYVSPIELKGTNYFDTDVGVVKYADPALEGYSVAENGNVMTAVYAVDKNTPTGAYSVTFDLGVVQDYDFNEVRIQTYTATINVTNDSSTGGDQPGGEGGEETEELSYTAGLSCDTETVMAPGTFAVEVFVDKSFASAEITIEYDSNLLKFMNNDSELYGAEFTNQNGTLKFWDYGETQNHGYTLCFKASGGAGEAEIELTKAAFSTQDKASVENLTRATIPADDSSVTVEIAAGNEDLTVEVEGATDAGVEIEADNYYTEGKAVTIQLKGQEVGYLYTVTATVNGEKVEVIDNGDGTYTIDGEDVVAGGIVFTVTKVLDTTSVKVNQYVKMDGATMYLVTCGTAINGKVYTYDGANMFWSDAYDSYCYLVIDSGTFTTDAAKAKIGMKDGPAVVIDYSDVDVNMTNKEDANDAQLVYNMYNAMYADFSVVSMEKFLRADVETDKVLNVDDAAAIIAAIQ